MEKPMIWYMLTLAFIAGFFSFYALNSFYIDAEKPFFIGVIDNNSQPKNWINEEQIEILQDRVIIHVPNTRLIEYAPTGSMLPTLGEKANGIKIKPQSEEEIGKGDIISFMRDGDLIEHRVVSKGLDENGVFFITKGDNNTITDGKVYFEDIEHVTIALIY